MMNSRKETPPGRGQRAAVVEEKHTRLSDDYHTHKRLRRRLLSFIGRPHHLTAHNITLFS